MSVCLRQSRTAIRVTGADARKLLSDVLTGEFHDDAKDAHWWALLSPQGKIQAEGLAGLHEGAWYLDIDRSVSENFQKRMRLYKMRADVTFEDLSESHAVGWSAQTPATGFGDKDPRGESLGYRVIADKSAAESWDQDDNAWHATRIAQGVTELGPDYDFDSQFPHDVAMDFLGGIDFEKGCFIGQEVVSRMKHRGTARRRPVIVSGASLEAGAPVLAGEREAGTLGHVAEGKSVAILRLDRIKDATSVTVGGTSVSLALPVWAGYVFGDSGAE